MSWAKLWFFGAAATPALVIIPTVVLGMPPTVSIAPIVVVTSVTVAVIVSAVMVVIVVVFSLTFWVHIV